MEEKTVGRPKDPKYETDYMIKQIDKYIIKNKKGVPILKECCLENDWNYDYVMQLQREDELLSQSTRKLLDYKEVQLEKGLLSGKLNSTGAIFSLKQLGWKDKPDNSINLKIQDDGLMDAIKKAVKNEV